jgi:hypothetical protein
VAAAKAPGQIELSSKVVIDGLLGRHITLNDKSLNAILLQVLGSPPTHTVTKDNFAVLQSADDWPVAMMLMVPFLALAPCMGRKGVVSRRLTDNLLVLRLENQKTTATAKVMGNGNTVFGGNCDLHCWASFFWTWTEARPPRRP